MLRETPSNVVTAHVREIEIQKQDCGHELEGESKSSRAGVRDTRITVPGRLQQRGESVGRIHIVIDYQYAPHIAPGRRLRSAPWIVSTNARPPKPAQRKLTGRGCWLRASKLLICCSASLPVTPY